MLEPPPLALAMTGASGAAYGLRLLEVLRHAGQNIYFMLSRPARLVIRQETDLELPARAVDIRQALTERYPGRGRLEVFGLEDWQAPPASGSAVPGALVICPCTSATLASVANGLSRNLIERVADVVLKEQRKLILVHRETPVSAIHLENMLKLARMGALIMPASPGFYHGPQNVEGLVDFMVARILDHLAITHHLLPRWGDGHE